MRDCEVLVSVACVRKLVALAFITQSERIQGSRSLGPAAPTSGARTESPEGWEDFGSSRTRDGLSVIRILRPWLCASSLGHGEADTG